MGFFLNDVYTCPLQWIEDTGMTQIKIIIVLTRASLWFITIFGHFNLMNIVSYVPFSAARSHKHNWLIILSDES